MATKKKKPIKLVCTVCKKSTYFTNKTKAVEEKIRVAKILQILQKTHSAQRNKK